MRCCGAFVSGVLGVLSCHNISVRGSQRRVVRAGCFGPHHIPAGNKGKMGAESNILPHIILSLSSHMRNLQNIRNVTGIAPSLVSNMVMNGGSLGASLSSQTSLGLDNHRRWASPMQMTPGEPKQFGRAASYRGLPPRKLLLNCTALRCIVILPSSYCPRHILWKSRLKHPRDHTAVTLSMLALKRLMTLN